MTTLVNLSRRRFLQGSAGVAGGLFLGFHLPAATAAPAGGGLNAFVRITSDGATTIVLDKAEMGQGVYTGIPMIIADELDADWARVRVEGATQPHIPDYWTPGYAGMATGGSRSTRLGFPIARKAGAAARAMLVEAAARRWRVDAGECATESGAVLHPATGRRIAYGELATDAGRLTPPAEPKLKTRDQWRLIGRDIEQLDIPPKVRGEATFGIDLTLPGLLTAAVMQCPVYGGTILSVDDTATRAVPGIRGVVREQSFVAVVADGYWNAMRGLEALRVTWNEGPAASLASEGLMRDARAALDRADVEAQATGDVEAAFGASGRVVEARYEVPLLAHACMEPMNCTARVTSESCTIWGPLQKQGWAQAVAARLTGLPPERVSVHTTFLGGGFGRRFMVDYVVQAVLVAKRFEVPVKIVWSRAEDLSHSMFRPYAAHAVRAALDDDGRIAGWSHTIAQPSILNRWVPDRDPDLTPIERIASTAWAPAMLEARLQSLARGFDPSTVDGIVSKTYYSIPHRRVRLAVTRSPVPVSIWRAVGNTGNAFVFESMVDELAYAAGADPYHFRRTHLADAPRHRAVLDLAAEKAGWDTPLPPRRHRGIALHQCYGGIAAHVVEVSVGEDGALQIHQIVAVLDGGTIVNPRAALAQLEGGTIQGLSAALTEAMTIENGRAVETNFDRYRLLTMAETPPIETHLVASTEPPGGVGEPGLPTIAPALCNAVFAATGVRIRSLPLSRHVLRPA